VWLGSICTDSVSDLLWADGSGSDGSQREGIDAHRRARFPASGALEFDGGEVPASGDGDGVVDAMRMATANSNPWSVTGISSGTVYGG
jgi:hypothetical protein